MHQPLQILPESLKALRYPDSKTHICRNIYWLEQQSGCAHEVHQEDEVASNKG